MPTNRPFLSNFLAAFRAHSSSHYSASTSSSAAGTSSQSPYHTSSRQQTHASPSAPSSNTPNGTRSSPQPININTKGGQQTSGVSSAAVQFQPTRQHTASPYSRSPGSPGSPGFSYPLSSPKHRRGSDSSSEGFRDALGGEKWYIGGRTATGEERFYRLGMIKRPRSIDRLSIDRLSL